MKNLLQTHSISWAESVRIVLESEGIDAVVLDPNAPGFIGFAGRTRVAVLHDDDLPKAQEILRSLQPPMTGPPPSWRVQKRGLICLGLGALVSSVAPATLDLDVADPLENIPLVTWILLAAAGLLVAAGFTLILLGPRADRKRNQAEP